MINIDYNIKNINSYYARRSCSFPACINYCAMQYVFIYPEKGQEYEYLVFAFMLIAEVLLVTDTCIYYNII